MVRMFVNGEMVGEQSPPVDFDEWLRSEIEFISRPGMLVPGAVKHNASVHARKAALKEVQRALDDSRRVTA